VAFIRIMRLVKEFNVLLCESSSFMILWLSVCCVLSGPFATAGIPSYVHIVIVGPYTFESRIHKVTVEFPNIIEGLVGVQLCTLFLHQICPTDGSLNTTSASGIFPTEPW